MNGVAYADAVTRKQNDAALHGVMAAWHVTKLADAATYTNAALAAAISRSCRGTLRL